MQCQGVLSALPPTPQGTGDGEGASPRSGGSSACGHAGQHLAKKV